ncbi:MAG: hypothetical protein NTZ48_02625, partial [Candidatus Omnitrophica bacterium]|nr:hypothetical protein [Candidatus Omnitrophota bacterium]
MKKNLMQRVLFGFIFLFSISLALSLNAFGETAPSQVPPATQTAEAPAVTPVAQPQEVNTVAETASMQGEIAVLQTKVDNLEKTVAAQAELIKQQSLALEKIIQSVPEAKVALTPPEPKTLVKKFVLNGVNLFGAKDLEFILTKYRDRELTMTEIKRAADELTAYYRRKGYVSSGAVVPPQEITDNTVEFKITEGRVGDITIETPKYSKKRVIENRFLIEKGEVLNAKKMETNLKRLNRQPDRVMRAVLSPGKTPDTSDLLLKVEKEDKPTHFYTEMNNRGTKYTKKDRYGLSFVNNNFLGNDDILTLKGISNFKGDVYSLSGDYNAPVSRWDTRVGAYGAIAKADIGGQFSILSPQGRARIWGIYVTQPWFDKEFIDETSSDSLTISSNLTAGLDSIGVRNKLLGTETSHDELRILKAGINFDEKDSLGRSVITLEEQLGIAGFLGSMEKHDVNASRRDAGGEFDKVN